MICITMAGGLRLPAIRLRAFTAIRPRSKPQSDSRFQVQASTEQHSCGQQEERAT